MGKTLREMLLREWSDMRKYNLQLDSREARDSEKGSSLFFWAIKEMMGELYLLICMIVNVALQ